MAFDGDQGGHGILDQSRDAHDGVPQRCLANKYHPFSARRALFLGRVVLGYYVIYKVDKGIISLGGGLHRFKPCTAFEPHHCGHANLRATYGLGRVRWALSQVWASRIAEQCLCWLAEGDRFTLLPGSAFTLGQETNDRMEQFGCCLFHWQELLPSPCIK